MSMRLRYSIQCISRVMTSGRLLNDGEEFKVRREGDKYYIHMGRGIHEVSIANLYPFNYRRVLKWLGIATGVYMFLYALGAAIVTPFFYAIGMDGGGNDRKDAKPWHIWVALVFGPLLSMLPDREWV